ncbi:RNA polymerase sigma factor SigA [Aquisphaera giovannonii]|uniref:RNA polymerase sigma factor SigA n=1 Tax=Aquisphaera giovannonii TaxID=406548 RepID=A0A5B9W5D5_9BACT|nr:RNA polymerase sigma factor RpoD/SigA [Aquisphaera giovannonii]QEH35798.1 RNA polymerase sigma factor SigA [Aquisphaera giovannonii]
MYCAGTRTDVDPGRIYDRDMRRMDLLSEEEERRLGAAAARGDREARRRLVEANLRLVGRIAAQFRGRGVDYEDLIGEGNLGLIRAAEGYDPRFGTRFGTYASYWIKQAIRHALSSKAATIRLPLHMYRLLSAWRRAERLLGRDLGHAPSFDEVAAHLGLTEARKRMVEEARRACRIRSGSGRGGEGGEWSHDEAVDASDAPEADLERADEHAEVLRRMGRLDPRERMVLALRFGLDGDPPRSPREIGLRLGVSRQWVRTIQLGAVRKLLPEAPRAALRARA